MIENVEWVSSREVMDLVYRHRSDLASSFRTEGKLRPKLLQGKIKAIAGEAELTDLGGRKHLKTNWPIEETLWDSSRDSSHFDLFRDWLHSTMLRGFRKVECHSLLFEKASVLDALEIKSSESTPKSAKLMKDPGGAPADAAKWASLVGVMAAYQLHRDIDPDIKPGTLYSLLAGYASEIGAQIPSKNTALPAMKNALDWCKIPHDGRARPLTDKDRQPLTDS